MTASLRSCMLSWQLVPSTSCAASRRVLTVAWEAWLLGAGPRDPRRWLEAAEPQVLAVPGRLLVLDVLTV